jgi:hypothetical protein
MGKRSGVGCERFDVLKANDHSAISLFRDLEETLDRKVADKDSFLLGGEYCVQSGRLACLDERIQNVHNSFRIPNSDRSDLDHRSS